MMAYLGNGGGSSYTVEHHDPPRERPPTPPRWDRTQPPEPPDEKKIKQVLKEESQRALYSQKRVAAFTKAAWDSDRPAGDPASQKGGNAYFSFPYAKADEEATNARDGEHNFATAPEAWTAKAEGIVDARKDRQSRCGSVAWNTPHGATFRSLGDVPMVPAAVRRKDKPSPVKILGDAWVPEKKADRGKLVPMRSGVPIEDSVLNGGHRYYSVFVDEGRRFTIRLRAYRGDPDLYVCNKNDRPDVDDHTWKSNAVGNVEELVIEPDDPLGSVGNYYIGVFGEKASDYRLEVEIVKPPIALPSRGHVNPFDKGREVIFKEVQVAMGRVVQAAAYGSGKTPRIESELQALGRSEAEIVAAGRPAVRAIRTTSDLVIRSRARPFGR